MIETYFQAVARVEREQKIHRTMDGQRWLAKQRIDPPTTEADRVARAYFAPFNEGAEIIEDAQQGLGWEVRLRPSTSNDFPFT